MDGKIDSYLSYLALENLRQHWNGYLKHASSTCCPYQHLLTTIISDEFQSLCEKRRLDRITENCTIFNMADCISIRKKQIACAAEKGKPE